MIRKMISNSFLPDDSFEKPGLRMFVFSVILKKIHLIFHVKQFNIVDLKLSTIYQIRRETTLNFKVISNN